MPQSFKICIMAYGLWASRPNTVRALKIVIYENIVCFCLQTSEMHEKLNK